MKIRFEEVKKKQSLCVYDNTGGAYLPIAQKMCNCFDKVYYYSNNQNPFPRIAMDKIGTGYEKLIRLDEFWGEQLDNIDIVMFPDIYCNDIGYRLRKMGKLVWGGTEAEQLETNRKLFKQELESVGLMNLPTEYVQGVDNLIKYLKQEQNNWVKLSYYRGEMETFHHFNFNHSEVFLEDIQHQLGPLGSDIEFIVERNMDSIAEIGYDGFTVNGRMANTNMFGFEIKNCGYVGTYCDYSKLPDPVKIVNDKFNPVLQKYGHTGFYSNEIRYTESKDSYYIDPCIRAGSPPSNTMMEMITNWDEIIPAACKNYVIEPKFKSKYGVELILKSNYCNNSYLPVSYPSEFSDNVKLKGAFRKNNKDYIVPFKYAGFEMVEFGSVVVTGDNLSETMTKALEIASKVEGYDITFDEQALMKAQKQIGGLKDILNFEF